MVSKNFLERVLTKRTVLVVGTGTIGEPLIGLLCDFSDELGIGNVLFHKRTPLSYERSKVNSLIDRGAKLVVDESVIEEFADLGHRVNFTTTNALELADVVIDCTPAGNENKKLFYEEFSKNSDKVFIAQGSEKGFGIPFAHGINDALLLQERPSYIQVVSCNTHNIAGLIKTIDPTLTAVTMADFVCIRRASDISQHKGFIASPTVDGHHNRLYGTHHAQDAVDLLLTVTPDKVVPAFSSSMKLNTQYMHCIRFNIRLKGVYTKETILSKFEENKYFAITEKNDSGRVFSFGRDHGYYGRLLSHGVLVEESLHVYTPPMSGETWLTGFCFTPQDGNSLLSSIAAVSLSLHDADKHHKIMEGFHEYLFQEI